MIYNEIYKNFFLNINKIYFKFCISRINFFFKKKSNPNYEYNLLQNKKIALVGNSKNLLDLNEENIIDDYDVVIRINHLPDIKLHKKIGKRCDILMLTHGPMHLLNPNFVKIWLDNNNIYYSNYIKQTVFHYRQDWLFELKNILNANPSTGARSLHFLTKCLNKPDITLFGFTHEPKAWYHRLDNNWTTQKIDEVENSSSIHNNPIGHDFDAEKKYFNSLVNQNIKYFKLP